MSSAETPSTQATVCARCRQPLTEGQRVEHAGAIYCLSCVGQALNGGTASAPVKPHNPTVAVVLGLLPGLGQMYNRQLFKGVAVMAAFFVTVPLPPLSVIVFFWSMFDAYWTARWIRNTGLPTPPLFLPEWFTLGLSSAATPARVPPQPSPAAPAGVAPPPPYGWPPCECRPSPTTPAWGVLLIVLGALFLLNNFGVTWLTWDRMWPTAMLALGLYLILSFALARRHALAPDEAEPGDFAPTSGDAREEARHD